jgi:kumamolisin
MAVPANMVPLPGSQVDPVPGARLIGPVHPDERIEVTVRVRPRAALPATIKARTTQAGPPEARDYLTREQLAADHGAAPEDIAKVEAFAASHNLKVAHASPARRSVWLSGTAADMEAAFGVTLNEYSLPGGGTYRGRTGAILIPADLAGIIVGVFGLDTRPQARPRFRLRRGRPGQPAIRPAAVTPPQQFTPTQVAQLYDFPSGVDGSGQCIGIIELGGGFNTTDLETYFSSLGLKAPSVSSVSVDGGQNAPSGDPNSADGEVMLDIEVAGSVAPGAKIVVYFSPNTSQGFLDAITQAVHDTVNVPSVISISWGGPESTWSAQALEQFDQVFQAAAAVGVTVCIAAGDDGSSDGVADGLAHADFPASSPNVLACGGTTLDASGATISSEVVWNDGSGGGATGGGISDQFALPSYQQDAGVPPSANAGGKIGRGLPDVAADADPNTGYEIRVDGTNAVVGGTSAVAPLWAGLIALLNQALAKPVGFLNPNLYGPISKAGGFRDVTSGNNGAYSARPGWDACSGWGVADGARLLEALKPPGSSNA